MLEFAAVMASATKNRQKYGIDYFLEQTKTRQNHQQRFHVVSRFDALLLCVLYHNFISPFGPQRRQRAVQN